MPGPVRSRGPRLAGLLLGLTSLLAGALAQASPAAVPDGELEARVEALLGRMTSEEKISLMAGGSIFATAPVARLGLPAMRLSDGPYGVRSNDDQAATVFPTGSALAATWDPAVLQAVGAAVGREARALRVGVLLGPNVNIQRSPLGGRNFESHEAAGTLRPASELRMHERLREVYN
jgi:beta-glucosidase